ncbi:hypothetical protein GQN11_24455, partial [Escherichia coli]|nr:hypothetical protein [Escherichia coli]
LAVSRGGKSDAYEQFIAPYLKPDKAPDFNGARSQVRDWDTRFSESGDNASGSGESTENQDRLSALKDTSGSISQVEVKPTYQIRAEFNITQKPGEDAGQLADRVTKNLGDIHFGQRSRMTDGYESWG